MCLASSLLAACGVVKQDDASAPSKTDHVDGTAAAPQQKKTFDPSWIMFSENDHYPDAFEEGVLKKVKSPKPPKQARGHVSLTFSSDGTIWYENGEHRPHIDEDGNRAEYDDWLPEKTVEFDPITGAVRDWGLDLYKGKADAESGNGGSGSKVRSQSHVVWTPRKQTFELDTDDYDVWVADPDGLNARKIGTSTVDDQGLNRNVFGEGSDPINVADDVYWVESETLENHDDALGMSIFSAPTDASTPMKEEILGGWAMESDLCATADSPSFTYVVSAQSTGDVDQPAQVHRRTFDAQGAMVSDDVLWTAVDVEETPDYVSACGDVLAVGRYVQGIDAEDPITSQNRLDIVRDGKTTTIAWEEFDYTLNAVRATPFGVFFVEDMMGGFFYDFKTSRIYKIGEAEQMLNRKPGYRAEENIAILLYAAKKDADGYYEDYEPLVVMRPDASK
ncbi:hypothetical protein [Timonella sp. A28]|uniref:hypothetical protein n=1 Tax=Timonella sp. A28 TaxID=3442640 RepID=UPI003EBEA8D3